jgi:hypothetical protein
MSEERSIILKMVSQGTITAEEAMMLLDALGGGEPQPALAEVSVWPPGLPPIYQRLPSTNRPVNPAPHSKNDPRRRRRTNWL